MQKEDDADLVTLASRGCAQSFEKLVRQYHLPLRAFLVGKVGDRSVADDLAQEVFIVAFRKLESVRQYGSFRSWLFSIARNKAVDYVRTRLRNKETLSGSLEHLLVEPQAALFSDDPELLAVLRRCMAKLSPQARSLVRSYYFDNKTSQEIALLRKTKSGAVRMSLMRVRKSLAKCIQLNSEVVHE